VTGVPVLLDVNLLVALTWPDHVMHRRAQAWFADLETAWATTSATETGFIRISMNPHVTTHPVAWNAAVDMLVTIRATSGHTWWEEDVDLLASPIIQRAPVVGYRQLTDVHLAALAARHSGRVATLDEGVVEALHPDDRALVVSIPAH
jgi:toxin-antitoxin system PIN domain toxin